MINPEMKTLVFSPCIVKARLTMLVAISSEVLPLFRSFVSWCKITLSGDISSRHPFTWCAIPFAEAPGIDLTETVGFILLFKRQPLTCFRMESLTIRVFFLGKFMDSEFYEGSLCGVVLLSFNIFICCCYSRLRANYYPKFVNLRV